MKPANHLAGLILVLLATGVLFGLIVASGIIAKEDATRLGLMAFGTVSLLWYLDRLTSLAVSQFAVLALLFLHGLNVARYTILFEYFPAFDEGRLPLTMIVGAPLLLAGWRGLVTGPGFAAVSVPLIYLAWAFISSGFGQNPTHSYFYAGWTALICIFIGISLGLHKDPRTFWRQWLGGLIILGLITSITSLIAIALDLPGARFQRYLVDVSLGTSSKVPGFAGIFPNPNTMAGTSLLSMGAAIAYCYVSEKKRPKWLEPVLVICGSALLLSGSRAGFLGLLAVVGCYIWLLRTARRGRLIRVAVKPFRTVIISILTLAALFAFSQSPVGRVGFDRVLGQSGASSMNITGVRGDIWRSIVTGMVDHPVFGTGYMSRPMQADWEALRTMPGQLPKSAHSAPFEYGMNMGLIGLLLFLWMLWGGVRGLLREGERSLSGSALIFWICSAPVFLFQAHGNEPSAPLVWPLWVLLLTLRGINGMAIQGRSTPPWLMRFSMQEEIEFRRGFRPLSLDPPEQTSHPHRPVKDNEEPPEL